MTTPTLAELLLLPDHEINYGQLDVQLLMDLALQQDEPFLATSALGELAKRDSSATRDVALRVIQAETWDKHLTAFALLLLFRREPARGLVEMSRLLENTPSATVIQAMVENVLSEPAQFEAESGLEVIRRLVSRVRAAGAAAFPESDEIARFLASYR